MRGYVKPKLLAVFCVLAVGSIAYRANSEAAPPAAEQSPVPNPRTVTPETPASPSCKSLPQDIAGGASVVKGTDQSLQHKSWQAKGGEIQFTVKSLTSIPSDASVTVCFRWKSAEQNNDVKFYESRPSQLDLSDEGKLLKVTTTVPADLGPQPPKVETALWLFPFVPLTEVRILAAKDNQLKAEASTEIGITYPVVGVILAVAIVALGLFFLHIAVSRRLKEFTGILQAPWLLRIIATPSGFASLSQLQILLWTSVVAASAVYVMSLSGQLIQITNGTLVLLGIAGSAGVLAKVQTESENAALEDAAAKAAAEHAAAAVNATAKAAALTVPPSNPVEAARLAAESDLAASQAAAKAAIAAATKARAAAMKKPPPTQVPRWSDLIVNESVKDDGTVTREIDVTRFQMLLFTLITAFFVLMTVIASYVIPEISTGFQTLMGISNGVYITSKFAQKS